MDHFCLHCQFRGERIGQLAFETDKPLRLLRIGIDIRSAALGIRSPEKHATIADFFQMVGGANLEGPAGEQEDKNEMTNS